MASGIQSKRGRSGKSSAQPDNTPPLTPALSYWIINQELKKLEENYKRDQSVEGLKHYVKEIKSLCEEEIEAGRLAASLRLAFYQQKVLVSVKAKINSLVGNTAFRLWRTGGGGPGEQATVEEAQRAFNRLVADLESEVNELASEPDAGSPPSSPAPSPQVAPVGEALYGPGCT